MATGGRDETLITDADACDTVVEDVYEQDTVKLRKQIDDSIVAEEIVRLKRSKAGFLGYLTRLYRSIEEHLSDYNSVDRVCELKELVQEAWDNYAQCHERLLSIVSDEHHTFEIILSRA